MSAAAGGRRRAIAVAGVAGAALATGAGWSWWRRRDDASADARTAAQAEAMWLLNFDQPDGGRLSMASLRGAPLVVNFWATWCPPCVREMPALDRFARDFSARGWRVLGIAADEPQPVRDFLARQPVSFLIALAGFAGIGLSRQLGNLGGGLPFTVIFDRAGQIAHRHMGETRYEQLAAWAQGIS